MPLKPNWKASAFDAAGQTVNSDVFAENITPSEPPNEFVVEAAFNNDTRVSVTEFDGSTENQYFLHGNATFNGGELIRVSHMARNGSEYNYQLESAADIELLLVAEEHLEGE